jgi:hypothetical protein
MSEIFSWTTRWYFTPSKGGMFLTVDVLYLTNSATMKILNSKGRLVSHREMCKWFPWKWVQKKSFEDREYGNIRRESEGKASIFYN